MENAPVSDNRKLPKRLLIGGVAVVGSIFVAFFGVTNLLSADETESDVDEIEAGAGGAVAVEPIYELKDGGDLSLVDCDYIDMGPEGVEIYRSSRNVYLGIDPEVIADLRREGMDLIDVGELHGVDEEWVLGEIEKMHAHCLGLVLPEDKDDPVLVRAMERLSLLANNPPDGTGSGAAGEGLDRLDQTDENQTGQRRAGRP